MIADEDDILHAPLHEFVSRLCAGARVDDDELGAAMWVRAMHLDMPLELQVRTDADGALAVRASPPTQRVATTVLPVFHRLLVSIVAETHDDAS